MFHSFIIKQLQHISCMIIWDVQPESFSVLARSSQYSSAISMSTTRIALWISLFIHMSATSDASGEHVLQWPCCLQYLHWGSSQSLVSWSLAIHSSHLLSILSVIPRSHCANCSGVYQGAMLCHWSFGLGEVLMTHVLLFSPGRAVVSPVVIRYNRSYGYLSLQSGEVLEVTKHQWDLQVSFQAALSFSSCGNCRPFLLLKCWGHKGQLSFLLWPSLSFSTLFWPLTWGFR